MLLLSAFKDPFPLELFLLVPNCHLGCLVLTLLLKSCLACADGASVNTKLDVDSDAAAAKSFQLCPTLCDPIDGSPPGSPVPGILQARTLEWVAISFSNA